MKVLAAIVIPPHLIFSGAARAAEKLSIAIAPYCPIDIAVMSSTAHVEEIGPMKKHYRKSTLLFPGMEYVLPNKYRSLFYKSDIPQMIRKCNYDLVHIHNVMPALEMARIARACVDSRKPYIISTHGFVEVSTPSISYGINTIQKIGWKYLVTRPVQYVVQHASMVFHSSEVESALVDEFGGSNVKKRIVKNGIDQLFFQPPSLESRMQVYQKFGLQAQKDLAQPVVFFLGNHTPNKGIKVLLDAFMLVDKPYLLIVGGEKRSYIDYNHYQSSTKHNQAIIFTGKLSLDEVRALYDYADLFTFPTLADTFPLVILEAMAAGLPVLSTRVGGIPSQVDDQCAVLVEPGHVIQIRNAYEKMTADREGLQRMGENAKRRASLFSWDYSAQEAVRYYHETLTT